MTQRSHRPLDEQVRDSPSVDTLPSYDPPPGAPLTDLRTIARKVASVPAASCCAVHVAGGAGCVAALLARALAQTARPQPLIVCIAADADAAHQLASDLRFVCSEGGTDTSPSTFPSDVLLLTSSATSPFADINPDRRTAQQRIAALSALACRLPVRFLVMDACALVRKVPPRAVLRAHAREIGLSQWVDRDVLTGHLATVGYLRVPVVEDPGTFAVRGSVLDVWPAGSELPARLEFLGDTVQSIRLFAPERQQSVTAAQAVWLPPAREVILTENSVARATHMLRSMCDAANVPSRRARAMLEDLSAGRISGAPERVLPALFDLETVPSFVPAEAVVLLEDPAAIAQAVTQELDGARSHVEGPSDQPNFSLESYYGSARCAADWLDAHRVVALHRTSVLASAEDSAGLRRWECAPEDTPTLAAQGLVELRRAVSHARSSQGRAQAWEPLLRRIQVWIDHGMRVLIVAAGEVQAQRLVRLLQHRSVAGGVRSRVFDPGLLEPSAPVAGVTVVRGSLARGVVAPTEALVLLTEEEALGVGARRRLPRRFASADARALDDLRSLSVGDLVVHVDHGIGRYQGLVNRLVGSGHVDLVVVEYAAGDKLYLPVYRLNQIHKHSGSVSDTKLDRLGGSSFARTKARARRRIRKIADELVRLYAQRHEMAAVPLAPPDDEYRAFEARFAFEETPDQAQAVEDVLRDLEAPRPMDRLVCGDVGFGKTEVALRAAFRMVSESRQVAVLCPTTVLAAQHLMTFAERMKDTAIEVRPLSRFQTPKQQQAVVEGLRKGTVDIVIGTHRLLSKDVHFRALGLLVVDEEQRFGVTHKERIKQLKTSVDVLTLSATPIPRTLQMAISGLRDISMIETAPVDRRAIRTIVTRPDHRVLSEAIRRELSRAGQVFYVYNRVAGLYERASKLQQLVPEARIAVAHGQMREADLERTMVDFVAGRFDVLVSTAIVESGLDIPRANTIMIDRADTLGLAQLYQLRGRVGRASERAYCYLVVPPPSEMTDEARARIEAIEQHTELGSGFRVASLDLELRGAGDLLGSEQSGVVESVGFDLFHQMLRDAVAESQGRASVPDLEPEISLDVEAYLPEGYIDDIGVRLALYKRLAASIDEQDVDQLSGEMQDRFGPPPPCAERLLQLMRLKTQLRRLRVVACEADSRCVALQMADDHRLAVPALVRLAQNPSSRLQLTPDFRLTFRAAAGKPWADGMDALAALLTLLESTAT